MGEEWLHGQQNRRSSVGAELSKNGHYQNVPGPALVLLLPRIANGNAVGQDEADDAHDEAIDSPAFGELRAESFLAQQQSINAESREDEDGEEQQRRHPPPATIEPRRRKKLSQLLE